MRKIVYKLAWICPVGKIVGGTSHAVQVKALRISLLEFWGGSYFWPGSVQKVCTTHQPSDRRAISSTMRIFASGRTKEMRDLSVRMLLPTLRTFILFAFLYPHALTARLDGICHATCPLQCHHQRFALLWLWQSDHAAATACSSKLGP